MEITIPTNTTLKSIAKRSFYFEKCFAVVILLVSISVFIAALTGVRAALNHVPVDLAIDKINAKKKIDLSQLSHLIDIAKVSISLNDNPHYLEDLSTLLFYQAQIQGISNKVGIDTLKQTEQTMEHALSQSPANAYLWYRLATLQLLLQQPFEKVRKTLLMSIMTGPSEASYLISRLNLCLVVFSSFSKDDATLLQAQVISAWTLKPNVFLATCVYNNERLSLITRLLENKHPSILNDIRSAFEKNHH
jgi:hypothetical protein